MLKKCNKNLVFLYILDDNNKFLIPTYGFYSIIIDFGFSYIEDLENKPLWPSLNHTNIGFTSDRFDNVSDPKLFLVTVAHEIHSNKKSANSKKLKNMTRNFYKNLYIDWESGWDIDNKKCPTNYIIKKLKNSIKHSYLFSKYEYYCFDNIKTLIDIPVKKKSSKNIEIAFISFLEEFSKIEQQISSHFFCLYILKNIVDVARTVKKDYFSEYKNTAVDFFRFSIIERIDSISKFANLESINYEKMLCSLYCLANNMEGIYYECMVKKDLNKIAQYNTLEEYRDIDNIIKNIDDNILTPCYFTEDTTLLVIDNIQKITFSKKFEKEEIDIFNKSDHEKKVNIVCEFLKK
jgi:hypothetical protein